MAVVLAAVTQGPTVLSLLLLPLRLVLLPPLLLLLLLLQNAMYGWSEFLREMKGFYQASSSRCHPAPDL